MSKLFPVLTAEEIANLPGGSWVIYSHPHAAIVGLNSLEQEAEQQIQRHGVRFSMSGQILPYDGPPMQDLLAAAWERRRAGFQAEIDAGAVIRLAVAGGPIIVGEQVVGSSSRPPN